jgi:hypothetical protein
VETPVPLTGLSALVGDAFQRVGVSVPTPVVRSFYRVPTPDQEVGEFGENLGLSCDPKSCEHDSCFAHGELDAVDTAPEDCFNMFAKGVRLEDYFREFDPDVKTLRPWPTCPRVYMVLFKPAACYPIEWVNEIRYYGYKLRLSNSDNSKELFQLDKDGSATAYHICSANADADPFGSFIHGS